MSKYHAIATEVDGIRFASKREAQRYQELKLLERAGEIQDVKLQVRYPLIISGVKVATYVADFEYLEPRGFCEWEAVVEDCKGVRTPVYKLKRNLMLACFGIVIRET